MLARATNGLMVNLRFDLDLVAGNTGSPVYGKSNLTKPFR
jgi:hypothetical protein